MLAVMVGLGRRMCRLRRRAGSDSPHWGRLRRLRITLILHRLLVRVLVAILAIYIASMLSRHVKGQSRKQERLYNSERGRLPGINARMVARKMGIADSIQSGEPE